MTRMDEYARGRRDGVRWAIEWLHERGQKMNDPKAKAILDCAADNLGKDNSPKVQRMKQAVRMTTVRAASQS